MDAATDQLCSRCHARVSGTTHANECPACRGELIAYPDLNSDRSDTTPPTIDHRGIVLPPRHAVGGVITPR